MLSTRVNRTQKTQEISLLEAKPVHMLMHQSLELSRFRIPVRTGQYPISFTEVSTVREINY